MPTKAEILADIAAVESKLAALQNEKSTAAIDGITNRLKSNADALQHALKSAAYVSFMESKNYVDSLKSDIETTGTAIADQLGNQLFLKWTDDTYTTAKTFAHLKEGTLITAHNRPAIVIKFVSDFSGSTVTTQPLPQKCMIDGEPVSPYAARACAFDPVQKTLILANQHRLTPSQIVVISEKKYKPSHLVGTSPYFVKYQLELLP